MRFAVLRCPVAFCGVSGAAHLKAGEGEDGDEKGEQVCPHDNLISTSY